MKRPVVRPKRVWCLYVCPSLFLLQGHFFLVLLIWAFFMQGKRWIIFEEWERTVELEKHWLEVDALMVLRNRAALFRYWSTDSVLNFGNPRTQWNSFAETLLNQNRNWKYRCFTSIVLVTHASHSILWFAFLWNLAQKTVVQKLSTHDLSCGSCLCVSNLWHSEVIQCS